MKQRGGVLAVAIAALVIGILALVILPPQRAKETQTSTFSTTSRAPLMFASAVASDGLQLRLVLNATSMRPDGAITGYATVVNTSDQNLTVSPLVQSLNLTYWSDYISLCGMTGFMGYAVFQGHFEAGNISLAGNPLRLWPGLPTSCPGGNSFGSITFLPSGRQGAGRAFIPAGVVRDQLNLTSYTCKAAESSKTSCAYGLPGLVGYWNYTSSYVGSFASPSLPFVRFSPGEYTVLAWDDWNQYVYATFVVIQE